MDTKTLKNIVETLIFITDKPLSIKKIVELINEPDVTEELVQQVLNELQMEYFQRSAIEIRQVAEGYSMATKPEYSEYVRRLYKDRTMLKLSPAAIETLAIIAYRQPITKTEIEETRGVDCTAVLETLLERKLIRIVGRKETIGRPLLYGTTQEFLKYFGLNSLSDLPPLEQFIEESMQQNVSQEETTVYTPQNNTTTQQETTTEENNTKNDM